MKIFELLQRIAQEMFCADYTDLPDSKKVIAQQMLDNVLQTVLSINGQSDLTELNMFDLEALQKNTLFMKLTDEFFRIIIDYIEIIKSELSEEKISESDLPPFVEIAEKIAKDKHVMNYMISKSSFIGAN